MADEVTAAMVQTIANAAAASPFYPYDTTDTDFLNSEEAEAFYIGLCREKHFHTNNTFMRQLRSSTLVFAFTNGYLGEHGISPILETIRRIRIQALALPSCALEISDIDLICDIFAAHETIQRLDLRGNKIDLSSGKRLLALVGRNTHITELLLDEGAPKFLSIQQQCSRNANTLLQTNYCLVCRNPVIHNPSNHVERSVLVVLLAEHYKPLENGACPVEVEAVFRLLLNCCQREDGVLFLCSEDCCARLASDLFVCAQALLKACQRGASVTSELPRNPGLKSFTEKLITEFSARELPPAAYTGAAAPVPSSLPEAVASNEEYLDDVVEAPVDLCTVCGVRCTALRHGASLMMAHLYKDVVVLRTPVGPSALVRLCKVMAQQAWIRPCSRKCSRQMVRFGLCGFGGVTLAAPTPEPLVSSLRLSLDGLPVRNFTVVDFKEVVVDVLEEEETTCALTVASMMEDIEGVPVDPYMIFALGRHLRKQTRETIGMQLQSACNAVSAVGCLPVNLAPFNRRAGARPPRDTIAHWEEWGRIANIKTLLNASYAHRRQGVYAVDGPHRNLFDNLRAALWAFRRQRRSAVVVMKFCMQWLVLIDGVVPESGAPKGGFYTTVKVVGQTTIGNAFYLIVQGNFGAAAGARGFFYIPKNLFNRYTRGMAYMFVSFPIIRESMQLQRAPKACKLLSSWVPSAAEGLRYLKDILYFIYQPLAERRFISTAQTLVVRELLRSLPPALFILYRNTERRNTDAEDNLLMSYRHLIHTGQVPSLVMFVINEILGGDVVRWAHRVLQTLRLELPCWAFAALHRYAVDASKAAETSYEGMENTQRTTSTDQFMWYDVQRMPLVPASLPSPQMEISASSKPKKMSMRKPSTRAQSSSSARTKGSRMGSANSARTGRPRGSVAFSSTIDGQPSAADAVDPQRQLLDQLWAAERRRGTLLGDWHSLEQSFQHADGASSASLRNSITHLSTMRRSSAQRCTWAGRNIDLRLLEEGEAVTGAGWKHCDEIPHHLAMQQWSAMHLTLEDGTFSEFTVFFIGNSLCVYNISRQLVVLGVVRMSDNEVFGNLPFRTGLDCVFNDPRNPRMAFLFCDTYWLLWDAYRQECIAGPHALQRHAQFQKLPPDFHQGVTHAIPVPGSSLVFFFTDQCYVAFDLERREPAGFVHHHYRRADSGRGTSAQTVGQDAEGMESDSSAPLLEMTYAEGKQHTVAAGPQCPQLPDCVLKAFPCGPMAALWARCVHTDSADPDPADTNSVLLIGTDGHLLKTAFDAATDATEEKQRASPPPPSDRDAEESGGLREGSARSVMWSSIADSPLSQLPVPFRQMTTDALAALHVLESDRIIHFNTHGITSVTLYEPGTPRGAQCTDTIASQDSQLIATSSGANNDPAPPPLRVLTSLAATEKARQAPHSLLVARRMHTGGPLGEDSAAILLSDEVHYVKDGARKSGGVPYSDDDYIEFDLGVDEQPCAFGAVVVIFDVSQLPASALRVAPVVARVESSMDRACYLTHSTLVAAAGGAATTCWGEVHVARYWRLCFSGGLPRSVGVVRVLWYHAEWSPVSSQLAVLLPYMVPVGSAKVDIVAGRLLQAPDQLLGINGGAVFETPIEGGWFNHHVVLPLLPDGSSCLFLCGKCFIEYDTLNHEVISTRTARLDHHPAFMNLPYPFLDGLDAAFYPDCAESPNTVALLRDGLLVHWDLLEGRALSPVSASADSIFAGIPVDMSNVYDVVNVWRSPGLVYVVFPAEYRGVIDTEVVVWNLQQRTLVAGPAHWGEFPQIYCRVFEQQPLLCLYSLPSDPNHFHVFCSDKVASPAAPTDVAPSDHNGGACLSAEPRCTQLHLHYYRILFHLNAWGTRRHDSIIYVDLRDRPQLIMGVTLTSSFADDRAWEVAFSDDNVTWKGIGLHQQSSCVASTTWKPYDVEGTSHRFWRLSAQPRSAGCVREGTFLEDAVLYSQLRFLIIPTQLHTCLPDRIAHSGKVNGLVGSIMNGGSTTLTFRDSAGQSPAASSQRSLLESTNLETIHHVTMDYGNTPTEVIGFSCSLNPSANGTNSFINNVWTVLCSKDCERWTRCGTWRINFAHAQMFWLHGSGVYRYWRVELQAGESSLTFSNFCFYAYQGPSVSLIDSAVDHRLTAPSPPATTLLWSSSLQPGLLTPRVNGTGSDARVTPPMTLIERNPRGPVRFHTIADNAILLDASGSAAVVAVELHCSTCTAAKVEFAIEYSDEGVSWAHVGTMVHYAKTHSCSHIFRDVVGAHRHWRLRVLSHGVGNEYMLLDSMLISVSESHLYRAYIAHRHDHESAKVDIEGPACLRLDSPRHIVKVKATLPPNSVYAVECVGSDCVGWRIITLINNKDVRHSATVSAGWPSEHASSTWRLRHCGLAAVDLPGGAIGEANRFAPPRAPRRGLEGLPVTWYAFAAMRAALVDLNAMDGVEVSAAGFDEHLPCTALTDLRRSIEEEPCVLSVENAVGQGFEEPVMTWRLPYAMALSQVHVRTSTTYNAPEEVGGSDTEDDEARAAHATSEDDSKSDDDVPSLKSTQKMALKRGRKSSKPPLKAAKGKGETAAVSAGEEEEHTEQTSPPSLVVETSGNGVDFVPVGECLLAGNSHTVKWADDAAGAVLWRLRLHNIPQYTTVSVHGVRWLSFQSVSGRMYNHTNYTITDSAYAMWCRSLFSNEESFCARCRAGLDQAKSKATKLREPQEVERHGVVAGHILRRKKTYQAFISKLAKEAIRREEERAKANKEAGANGDEMTDGNSEGELALPSVPTLDIAYFLHKSTEHYGCNFEELCELLEQPMPLKSVTYCKKDSHWFYPHFEVHGTLQRPFHGLVDTIASLSVYWSLSHELQRNTELLEDVGLISDVNEHVASPLVCVSVRGDNWRASDHFPDLPFLYHMGFSECPLTIVFALNEIPFSAQYNLQIPSGKQLPAPYPFKIYPGVNFIRYMSLSGCPAPIFEKLRYLYTQEFLRSFQTTVVFSAPSQHSCTSKVRFTLPGNGNTFGVNGLFIDSIEFEITMTSAASFGGFQQVSILERNVLSTVNNRIGSGGSMGHRTKLEIPPVADHWQTSNSCDYTINFVTHGATYMLPYTVRVGGGGAIAGSKMDTPPPMSLCLVGGFDKWGKPTVLFNGTNPSINFPAPYIPRCFITDVALRGSATFSPTAAGQVVHPSELSLEARLVLPSGVNYPCYFAFESTRAYPHPVMTKQVRVHLTTLPLDGCLHLLHWFMDFAAASVVESDGNVTSIETASSETKSNQLLFDWTKAIPITLSVALTLNLASMELIGTGSMQVYGSVAHNLSIIADRSGYHITAETKEVSIGEIHLKGAPDHGTDVVHIDILNRSVQRPYSGGAVSQKGASNSAGVGITVTFSGYSGLLSSTYAQATVELTRAGTMCMVTTSLLDACIEENTFYPSAMYAQVTLRENAFAQSIQHHTQAVPLLVALQAHGIPFVFTIHNISADVFSLRSRCLHLTARGVLFGGWFDVTCSITEPEWTPAALELMTNTIAMRIVEQCEGALWESYSSVVGCAAAPGNANDGEEEKALDQLSAFHGGEGRSSQEVLRRHCVTPQGMFHSRWVKRECELFEDCIDLQFK